jgi:hypothetical protein
VTLRRVANGRVDGAVPHALSYLGQKWGTGPEPRYSTEQAVEISRKLTAAGAVITWDVPIQSDGTIAKPFMDQLKAINEAIRRTPASQPTDPTTQPRDE